MIPPAAKRVMAACASQSDIADVAMALLVTLPNNHLSGNIAGKKGQAGALVGKRIIITSGPTIEPIDKVRFIANRSSGKQGHAIAAALAGRGANVTLVSGPVNEAPPGHVNLVPVTTAAEMLTACTNASPLCLPILPFAPPLLPIGG